MTDALPLAADLLLAGLAFAAGCWFAWGCERRRRLGRWRRLRARHAAEVGRLEGEALFLRALCGALSDRVHDQGELLAKQAEREGVSG